MYIEEYLHPWDKHDLIMGYDLCNVLNFVCWGFLNSASSEFLLRIFASMFISDIGLYFYLCVCVFVICVFVLISGWWWPCRLRLKVFHFLQFFWRSFRRIDISFSQNVWLHSPMKPFGPAFSGWDWSSGLSSLHVEVVPSCKDMCLHSCGNSWVFFPSGGLGYVR